MNICVYVMHYKYIYMNIHFYCGFCVFNSETFRLKITIQKTGGRTRQFSLHKPLFIISNEIVKLCTLLTNIVPVFFNSDTLITKLNNTFYRKKSNFSSLKQCTVLKSSAQICTNAVLHINGNLYLRLLLDLERLLLERLRQKDLCSNFQDSQGPCL